jgi:hypothetical protein
MYFYLSIFNNQIAVNLEYLVIAIFVSVVVLYFFAASKIKDRRVVGFGVLLFIVSTSYAVGRNIVAAESTWLIIAASIKSTSGNVQRQRIEELRPSWFRGGIRTYDWYFLSKKWGICHELNFPEHEGCTVQKTQSEFASGKYLIDEYIFKTESERNFAF